MKFVCQKKDLTTLLGQVQGALIEKNFNHIFFHVEKDLLKVETNDSVLSIISQIPIVTFESGKLAFPAKFLVDLAKDLPNQDILFEKVRGCLEISCENLKVKTPYLENFLPRPLPILPPSLMIDISSKKLSYGIQQILFCVSNDAIRDFGSVAFFHQIDPVRLRVVGTDSYRLSYCEIELEAPTTLFKNGVCLTKRGLSELLKISNETNGFLRLGMYPDSKILMASNSEYRIYMNLSAVVYPDYEEIVPQSSRFEVCFQKDYFSSVMKRLSSFLEDKKKGIFYRFSNKKLEIISKNSDFSECSEFISVEEFQDEPVSLVLSAKAVQDVLNVCSVEQCSFKFQDEETPVVLSFKNEQPGLHSTHMIIPIEESNQFER